VVDQLESGRPEKGGAELLDEQRKPCRKRRLGRDWVVGDLESCARKDLVAMLANEFAKRRNRTT
jgi:hypothetical protein